MADEQKKETNQTPAKFNATTKKQSFTEGLFSYALNSYIVPKSKDLLHNALGDIINMGADALNGCLNKAIYGEDKPVSRKGNDNTPYATFYQSNQNNRQIQRNDIGQRSSVNVDLIVVDSEETARGIINGLTELISRYGNAKVADLYEMLKPQPKIGFTDYQFGWTDSRQFSYHKEYIGEYRNQYVLDLPTPVNVKN